jgi:hypothetical protein
MNFPPRSYIYVKFLALLGAPYIYDISRLRVNFVYIFLYIIIIIIIINYFLSSSMFIEMY